jgi:hypothetical protein
MADSSSSPFVDWLSGNDERGIEEAKRAHVLALDMRAHAEPVAQLSDVGMASHGGEVARVYQGNVAPSVLPWWSSAASAIPPVGATSGAASFADAVHSDRHADASFKSGDGGGPQKAARYQPKPPAVAKRAGAARSLGCNMFAGTESTAIEIEMKFSIFKL